MLGLTWRNIDLDTSRLVVSQSVLPVEYQASVADVKTAHSRWTVDLDARTVAVVRAWRRRQIEEQLSTGRRDDASSSLVRTAARSTPDCFSQTWGRPLGWPGPAVMCVTCTLRT